MTTSFVSSALIVWTVEEEEEIRGSSDIFLRMGMRLWLHTGKRSDREGRLMEEKKINNGRTEPIVHVFRLRQSKIFQSDAMTLTKSNFADN